jgi:nucleotide-binding universal stress UspA family protein
MAERVLVAVDLSETSMAALRAGQELAKVRGAALGVVYVAPSFGDLEPLFPQNYGPNPTVALETEQIAREAFEQRVAKVQGSADAEWFFERGSAYAEIVRRAEAWAADLLIVGSHGTTGLERALLGSVAAKVVRYAHCPVLVSRPERGSGVVVGATDLSDPSLPAVAYAADEARQRGARVVVVHALHGFLGISGDTLASRFAATAEWLTAHQEQAVAASATRLEQALARVDANGSVRVLTGRVVSSIIREVDRLQADLLVVGTHGHTGLARLLLGSVAEELIRLATCSVLVVRQHRSPS